MTILRSYLQSRIPPLRQKRHVDLNLFMVLRALGTAAIVSLLMAPAFAQDMPRLRSEVNVHADTISLKDLVENLPQTLQDRPLFRSPALGENGTIQAFRIAESLRKMGIENVDMNGRSQVYIIRPAKHITSSDIETAIKQALERRYGINASFGAIVFDNIAPTLMIETTKPDAVLVENLSYEARSKRVSAQIRMNMDNAAPLRITGIYVETVEVPVLNRSVNRNDAIQPSDYTLERRARDTLPADAALEIKPDGLIARRSLVGGSILRSGDVSKPEAVAKGDVVTILYQTPGLMLTMRGRAVDAGAKGDVISVQNPQSKKIIQGTIIGPGQVSVSQGLMQQAANNPAKLASAALARP
jgi:flagellar basal body P-ring formation protein FlgA